MNNQAAQTMPALPVAMYGIRGKEVDLYTADQMHQYARDYAAALSQTAGVADGLTPSLRDQLQQKCSDWGTYWRAPDAHGVILSQDQATELLRDALCVEVEVSDWTPGAWSKLETWLGTYADSIPNEAYHELCAIQKLLNPQPKPEGVVVPADPTPEMVKAICQAHAGKSLWPTAFGGEARTIRQNHAIAGYRAMLAAAPAASATSKTHDRCTDPENCKRCSEDASTPHAGIPHAAPAASGVDTSTNEAWAARAQEKIATMDAAASVSERAPLLAIIAEAIRNAERHPRQQYGLNLATLRALEQALTQQRGAVAWTHDAESWGNALNEAAWVFVGQCPEKSALLFNNTKAPLRAAILKYAELVGATTPQPSADAVRELQSACEPFIRHNSSEQFIDLRVPTSAVKRLRGLLESLLGRAG